MFLGKSYKELILEATKWKLLFSFLVVVIAEISIFQADITPMKNRIYVGVFLFFFSYVLSHTASLLVHAVKTLILFLKALAPETPYTQSNKETRKHDFIWWFNFVIGIAMATLFLDFIFISGAVFGFIIVTLFIPRTLLDIRYRFSDAIANIQSMSPEALFVFFLVFGFFVYYFAAQFALADSKVRLEEKVTPFFVFQRTIMMIWTLGDGDHARDLEKEIRIDYMLLFGTLIFTFLIGWPVDFFADSGYWVRGILMGLGFVYQLLKDLYRIK